MTEPEYKTCDTHQDFFCDDFNDADTPHGPPFEISVELLTDRIRELETELAKAKARIEEISVLGCVPGATLSDAICIANVSGEGRGIARPVERLVVPDSEPDQAPKKR